MSQEYIERAPIARLIDRLEQRLKQKREVKVAPVAEAPTRRPIAPVVIENHPADPFEPLQPSLDEINDANQYYDGMNTTLLGIANAAMITKDPGVKCAAVVALGHSLVVSNYDGPSHVSIHTDRLTELKLEVIQDIVAVTTTTKDVRVYMQAIEALTTPFMQYSLDITNKDLTKGAVDAVYAIGDLHREARGAAIHSLDVALKFQGDQQHPRVDLSRVRKARTLLLSR